MSVLAQSGHPDALNRCLLFGGKADIGIVTAGDMLPTFGRMQLPSNTVLLNLHDTALPLAFKSIWSAEMYRVRFLLIILRCLISATAPPEEVAAIHDVVGRERAGALVEETLAAVARGLAAKGARRFVIAGGETAGAVVHALGVTGLRIGRQIDPGVPWTVSLRENLGEPALALALKSGNFGAPDFFLRAFSVLSE